METNLVFRILAVLLGLHAAAVPAVADTAERIEKFHSRIEVHEDGSLTVAETITVIARGEEIRRGIYRDFPTRYDGGWFGGIEVPFEVLKVERDGRAEPYHTLDRSNGVRVYIGRSDRTIPSGRHTYTLTYRTDRQLGYFDEHDELYWNVTGNGWVFPIEHASATVVLPKSVPRRSVGAEGYTGPQGAKGEAYRARIDGNGHAQFETTGRLAAYEGLTIVVTWPRGHVAQPTWRELYWTPFWSSPWHVLGGLLFLGLLAYYPAAWFRVGRDPGPRVIVPLTEPPHNLSPAAVRYIAGMGYDAKCFTAALLNMAVKGFLSIDEGADGTFTIERLGSDRSGLSQDEKAIASGLLSGPRIELKQENHARIAGAVRKLKHALQRRYYGEMFLTNRPWLVPGVLLSVGALVGLGLPPPGERREMFLFLLVWLSIWTLGVAFLVATAIASWRSVRSSARAASVGGALFISAFAVPFVGGELVGLGMLGFAAGWWIYFLVLLIAAVNLVFFHLIKRRTPKGRDVMDQIEGFRMYLAAWHEPHRPFPSPDSGRSTYERLLPYAVALDVEDEWARQFHDVLERAGEEPGEDGYCPDWYRGRSWHRHRPLGAFASGLGSSLAGAISSSSTAPGSSSGSGGGGSSGGGGGGGGGGGW